MKLVLEIKNNHKNKELIKRKKINSKWINDNEGIKISYLLYKPLTKKTIKQLKKNFAWYCGLEKKINLLLYIY